MLPLHALPESGKKRIVIIGGGFGGITLAKKLRTSPFEIVLLDKHNYHTFQPLLYQVATGGLEPDSIAYPLRNIFKQYKNFHFRIGNVNFIDPANNFVKTEWGEIKYNYVVIAAGSDSNFFGSKQLQEFTMPLKSLTEALDLRSLILQNFEKALHTNNSVPGEIEKYLNLVVIGGGPTGVEVAGALAELKKHVLPNDYPELDINKVKIFLVEAGNKILGTFSDRSSQKALQFLKKMGVQVMVNAKLKDYNGEIITFENGNLLHSACVIWSAGVKGVSMDGIKKEAMGKSSRIIVDEFNRVKEHQNIFAIGDIALMTSDNKFPDGHPMVAQVAIQQAKNVARNLKSLTNNKALKPFSYFDLGSLATVGRNKAIAEFSFIKFRGIFAWFIWMAVHLMALVGYRNRIIVFINWVWNYFSYDRAIRLIVRPFVNKF